MEEELSVKDTNAIYGERVHELVINGEKRDYVFPNSRTEIKVDRAAALIFSRLPGFEVRDSRGIMIKSHQIEEKDALGEIVSLAADQTIASFSELTHDALLVRAVEAGASFNRKTNKDAIVDFLIKKQMEEIEDNGSPHSTEEELEIEEMTLDEIENLTKDHKKENQFSLSQIVA